MSASDLTIYVAGGSAERDAVAGYLAQLRAAGWTVTYDWTTDPGWTDPTHPRIESARADVRGITRARVFWYVAPAEKSEGSHFELGVAWVALQLTTPKREILASGPTDILGRVFPSLATRAFAEHADALDWLLGYAHGYRQEAKRLAAGGSYTPFPAPEPEPRCTSCNVRGEPHRDWCTAGASR